MPQTLSWEGDRVYHIQMYISFIQLKCLVKYASWRLHLFLVDLMLGLALTFKFLGLFPKSQSIAYEHLRLLEGA